MQTYQDLRQWMVNAVSPEYRRQIEEKRGDTLAEMQRRANAGGR